MRYLSLTAISILLVSCSGSTGQRLEVVEFDALETLIEQDSEQIEVINFWATWCKPCIKEIPYFQELQETNEEVSVTLVSLDFADEFQNKVVPFVKEKGLTTDIILLDDLDYNSWIDKIDPSWSGAIPATLIINHKNGKRKFVEKELEEGEIESMIKEISD
ncbi:TlpA disulfide reductase family protein [Roseivirga sp.]|uniref:TlpA disulfide reductase family protein n=1 Tax=Roseivirga sp. TaxID=1964215 RepID=UPI003B52BA47